MKPRQPAPHALVWRVLVPHALVLALALATSGWVAWQARPLDWRWYLVGISGIHLFWLLLRLALDAGVLLVWARQADLAAAMSAFDARLKRLGLLPKTASCRSFDERARGVARWVRRTLWALALHGALVGVAALTSWRMSK
jgi:cob(I)alamin adenosyltransferase